MLIGLEAYNDFINCTTVQLMIFQIKTNKMADRYLNTNSSFVIMLITNKQSWLLVQFLQNIQTPLALLIPNCTRHRMITYTNKSPSSILPPIYKIVSLKNTTITYYNNLLQFMY